MNVRTNGSDAMYYVHTDHLGSLSSVYNASGSKIAEQSFDPWGRYRNPSTWQPLPPLGGAGGGLPAWLIRGYTGHEELPQFGINNMNARMYDPIIGQVLSPDNYVQFPDFTQSYNRFSYCINNPLKYTDPSGNKYDANGDYDFAGDELNDWIGKGATIIDVDGSRSNNSNTNTKILGRPTFNVNYIAIAQGRALGNSIFATTYTDAKTGLHFDVEDGSDAAITVSHEEFLGIVSNNSTTGVFVSTSQAGQVIGTSSGGADLFYSINSAIDNAITLTMANVVGAQRLANSVANTSYKVITKIPMIHTLGKLTGAVSAYDNIMKYRQTGNLWSGVKGFGQAGLMLFGGAEAELIFNLSTMGIDAVGGLLQINK